MNTIGENPDTLVRSYIALRKAIGVLGISLPIILPLGVIVLAPDEAPQIAEVLGISISAAEKRLARAFYRLKRAVERTTLVTTEPHSHEQGGE